MDQRYKFGSLLWPAAAAGAATVYIVLTLTVTYLLILIASGMYWLLRRKTLFGSSEWLLGCWLASALLTKLITA